MLSMAKYWLYAVIVLLSGYLSESHNDIGRIVLESVHASNPATYF